MPRVLIILSVSLLVACSGAAPAGGIGTAGPSGKPVAEATATRSSASPPRQDSQTAERNAAVPTAAASKGGVPTPSRVSIPRESGRAEPKVVEHGPRDSKRIALTFDADMTPDMRRRLQAGVVDSWYNQDVIRVLKKHKTPATLFLTGLWVESYPAEARALADNELFEIGNHSYRHYAFTPSCYGLPSLPDHEDVAEIDRSQETIREKTGETPSLFRFPGLCFDAHDAGVVATNGLTIVQGDVAAGDGFNDDTDSIVETVTRSVRNGSIVVMHMHGGPNAPKTADALERLIPALLRNYSLVTVSTLLNDD